MKKTLLIAFCLMLGLKAFSATYYVNASATGQNNGLSWENAFTSLQSALSVAIPNDKIWVATGVYKASATDNRSTSFVMKNGVSVYGGFNGTETTLDQRNIATAPTTLSGDIGEPGTNNDNTYKIVRVQNFTTGFTLDGFIISNGYDGTASGKGAGLYMTNCQGGINIRNCVFYNNYAYHSGGGLLIDQSSVTFENCDFLYNSTFNYGGGAIYSANASGSNISLIACKFTGNSARQGAVINFDGTSLIMDRNIVSSNTTSSGSIIAVNDADDFKVLNSLIVGNLTTSNSGSSVISSYTSSQDASVINTTVCHNRNSSTLQLWDEPINQANGAMYIHNSIVYGNSTTPQNYQIDTGNNVRNCILEGTYPASTTNNINNIFAAPQFVSPATLAAAPFDASGYDYSLLETSLGVNTGNNSLIPTAYMLDCAGTERIQGTVVDRGAYESDFILSIGSPETISNEVFFRNNDNTLVFTNFEKYRNETMQVCNLNGQMVKKK
ncbi:MAG: hypothetical protein EOO45_15505 [Flavobacterium sp.]|nr:MAG: hypothetical protein EOO45_15505 [Flavobacterium sp.]